MKTLASLLVRKFAQTKRPKRHMMTSTENWSSVAREVESIVMSKKVSAFMEKRNTSTMITSQAKYPSLPVVGLSTENKHLTPTHSLNLGLWT